VGVGLVPFGPSAATVSTVNASTAIVSWTPSTIANQAPIRGYFVTAIPSTAGASTLFKTEYGYRTSTFIKGISTNTYYRFLVQGVAAPGYCIPFAYTSSLGFGIISGAFSPSSLTGIQMWLDAGDTATVTLSGSNVTGWSDKSGTSKTTTLSGTKPYRVVGSLNSMNTIYFTGASQTYVSTTLSTAVGTGNVSMFAVWKPATGTGTQAVTGIGGLTGTAGTIGMGWHSSAKYLVYDWAENETTYSSAAGSWVVELGQRQSGQLLTTVNGSNAPTVSVATTNYNNTAMTVGAGPAYYTTGEVAEVLFYTSFMTPFDRQKVEGYLGWKWGLQSNLPATHPFKTAAPTSASVFSPSSFSSLTLWLDAADATTVTSSGGAISQWADKSGRGYNLTQATGSNQPAYTTSNITINSNRYFNIPQASINNASAYCYFMVFKPNSGSNWITNKQKDGVDTMNVWSMTYYTQSGIFSGSNGYMYYRTGNGNTLGNSGVALTRSNMQIITMAYTTATNNLTMYVNGSTMAITNGSFTIPNQTTANKFTLGAQVGGDGTIYNSGVTDFNLYEFGFYNGALSTDDRQTVEGYLAWKWGLQNNLPTTHPYYNINPGSLTTYNIVTSNLMLYLDPGNTASYPGSGSAFYDLSPARNHCVLMNSPTYSAAEHGRFTFNGTNQYISTPITSISKPFTMSVWVKFNSLSGWQTFAGLDTTNPIPGGQFYFQKAGGSSGYSTQNHPLFQIRQADDGSTAVSGSVLATTDTWFNYTVSVSPTEMKIYTNGILNNTTTTSLAFLNPASNMLLNAGYYNNAITDYLNGYTSVFMMYSNVLTAAEVLQNYNALRVRYT
jgi:hypothetical protein